MTTVRSHDRTSNKKDPTAAERQYRYRQRRRAGIQVVPVEVDAEIVDTLVMKGWLSDQDTLDPKNIAAALRELAEEKQSDINHQNVRLPPESGHNSTSRGRSVKSHKETFAGPEGFGKP